ncbi:MAG: hypothetical protein ACP5KA_06945 [Desulfurococcaceae archaeon]
MFTFTPIKKALERLLDALRGVGEGLLETSVEALEAELLELEYLFLSSLFGPLIGIKTLPLLAALELLDAAKDEVKVLFTRGMRGEDVIGDLFASMGGEW